jgi:hypothetical protein
MNDKPNQVSPSGARWRRLGVTALLLSFALLAVSPVLDQRAADDFESLFQRAVVTFALARTLNGVISAAQGTEVALQPAGVGVTLTPGEVLDPVNDLVERFSWIMLGATISLGIQNVLLDISAWWVLQGVVVLLASGVLILHWWKPAAGKTRAVAWRVLLIVLFLRFAVPLSLVANNAIYDLFLEARYEQSAEIIQAAGNDLEVLGETQEAEMEEAAEAGALGGVLDALGAAWDGATAGGFSGRLEVIQARAANLIEHLIQLSVVFVLQTGILPLVFLWLFFQLARWLVRPIGRP